MRIGFRPAHRFFRECFHFLAVTCFLSGAACAHLPDSLEGPSNPKEDRRMELLKTEEVIPLMPDGYDKANSYLELAELNEVVGEHVNAMRLLRKAGEVLSAIEEENCLQEKTLLLETARLELIMGGFEEALKYAKQVKNCEGEDENGERDQILEKISNHFISEQKFDEALGAAAEIKNEHYKNPLILRVIDEKMEDDDSGDAAGSGDPASSQNPITGPVLLENLLTNLEGPHPSVKILQQASEIVDGIKDPFQKFLKLLLLARAEYKIKGPGSERRSLMQAGMILRTYEEDSYSEVVLHWGLAMTQFRTGEIGAALRTLDSLRFGTDQTVGLLILALEYEKSENRITGSELMRRALERVEETRDLFWKALVYQTAAIGLIKKGRLDEARDILGRALTLYEKTGRDVQYEDLTKETEILKGQVESLLAAGTLVGINGVLKELESGTVVLPLLGAYSGTQNAEVFEGMDVVRLFEKEWERVLALSYISRNLTRNGQKEKAYKLARIWETPLIRIIILSNIAKGESMAGRQDNSNLLQILKLGKPEPEPSP